MQFMVLQPGGCLFEKMMDINVSNLDMKLGRQLVYVMGTKPEDCFIDKKKFAKQH
jgi:hypothetical protein